MKTLEQMAIEIATEGMHENELLALKALDVKAGAEMFPAFPQKLRCALAGLHKGIEMAAEIADRNDQSAWGIAREIRALLTDSPRASGGPLAPAAEAFARECERAGVAGFETVKHGYRIVVTLEDAKPAGGGGVGG